MASLKHALEFSTAKLLQEHERRLKAEAQLAALQPQSVGEPNTARALQEPMHLETRQLELLERMELLLQKVEMRGAQPAPTSRWPVQLGKLLAPLAAGILGGGVVVAMLPWLGSQRPAAQSPALVEPQPRPAASAGQVKEEEEKETVQFRCAEPCWLDIRRADNGKRVFYKLLKGTANFAVGSGLDVFSGRADLVKVRINDGPEQPLLPGKVVGSRVIRPAKPSSDPTP
jgi:hypothetical protein